jgi:hypothetical protein
MFHSKLFFYFHVYYGYGGHQIPFKSLYLFIFFLYSHLKMTGVQVVSCVMTKIELLLGNTFSESLIDNLTSSLHIHMQRFVLFFHSSSPSQSLCLQLFGKFYFVRSTPSTGNNKYITTCLSVSLLPQKNRTNLCIGM